MNVVVIIPTYNERENISVLLTSLLDLTSKIKQHKFIFLVTDDNSTDGTQEEVKILQKSHHNILLLTGKKEGLGRALLRSMNYAVDQLDAEIIAQIDADLSHDPKIFPNFIKAIDQGAEFVVGSRYIPGGSIPQNWAIYRKIYSVIGNAIVRYGLGKTFVHDWTGGYRAYLRKYVDLVKDELKSYGGYVFQIAFLHKSLLYGAKVTEIPIHFADRRFGRSKIAPKEYIRNVLVYVISERFKDIWSSAFSKFLIVGGVGFTINALVLRVLHENYLWSATSANLIGAGIAIFSNYNLNNLWTFEERKIDSVKIYFQKMIQFYLTSFFGVVVIQTGFIYLGVGFFGKAGYFTYFLVGTLSLLIWNYFMYSRMIWKKKI